MKFLCDVHISYKVVRHLESLGYEAIHVNDILDKWYTKDQDICKYADTKDLILLSKDRDFKDNYLIHGTPKKLIKINLDNITNKELIVIISRNLGAIEKLNLNTTFLVEIDKDYITFIK